MDFNLLVREVRRRSGRYVMVRPGITLRLTFPEPIQTLGPVVAELIEAYISFIRPVTLGTRLGANGAWKVMTERVLRSDLTELRTIGPRDEFVEYHYGHGEPSHVGDYGAHFVGSNLSSDTSPLEENLLLLEFPHDFLQQRSQESFVQFVKSVASSHPFGSGVAGYSFRHLHLTFRKEAFDAIREMAPRYLGFDINSDVAREYSRGHIYNVSWITLLGADLVSSLGGSESLRQNLPSSITFLPLREGLLLQASADPIVGDVNRGAADIPPLRDLAAATRRRRLSAPNIGPGGEFTQWWLARLDT